tara:strand:+ start:530 stop:1174 length:645 start_codon:yes stop_codon:yes gene_type:complete
VISITAFSCIQFIVISVNKATMNIFQTRVELIKELVNQNSVCAELGVLLGEFSESISNLSPQKLYLVDTWESGEIISADQNGNNFRQYKDGIQVFEHVKQKFGGLSNVEIIRSSSIDFLSRCPSDHLDFVYIDTYQDFNLTSSELTLSRLAVKSGGYICGHDFDFNSPLCNNFQENKKLESGVSDAVNSFCESNDLTIDFLGLDGCISYAIKNK